MGQSVSAQLSPIGIIVLALPAISVVLTMEILPECIQRDNVTPTVSCITNSASSRDWSKSENIYRQLSSGRSVAGIFFDYNGDGESADSATPGAGAALFLDGIGKSGDLTTGYGDIKISGEDMLRLLKALDQTLNPTIIIQPAD